MLGGESASTHRPRKAPQTTTTSTSSGPKPPKPRAALTSRQASGLGRAAPAGSGAYISQKAPRHVAPLRPFASGGACAERSGKMALLRQAYSALFRRTSTFALTIVLGAVLFERAFDQGADAIFEHLNEGVRNRGGGVPRREVRPGAGPGP